MVVYADDALDLTATGFVRAEGRVDATAIVRHTSDTTRVGACRRRGAGGH